MMTAPTAKDVAAFIGQDDDTAALALAAQALPVITALARGYTRGGGFIGTEPLPDVAAVLVTASARLMAHPEQVEQRVGETFTRGFDGWTLPELAILNRYRRRSM